jgi:hypothetical protein
MGRLAWLSDPSGLSLLSDRRSLDSGRSIDSVSAFSAINGDGGRAIPRVSVFFLINGVQTVADRLIWSQFSMEFRQWPINLSGLSFVMQTVVEINSASGWRRWPDRLVQSHHPIDGVSGSLSETVSIFRWPIGQSGLTRSHQPIDGDIGRSVSFVRPSKPCSGAVERRRVPISSPCTPFVRRRLHNDSGSWPLRVARPPDRSNNSGPRCV